MKIAPASPSRFPAEPDEDDIRTFAYHLYEQSDGAPGHDLDHWFEATACLKAAIPGNLVPTRLPRHRAAPIVHPV
jgi:hypothetical protein